MSTGYVRYFESYVTILKCDDYFYNVSLSFYNLINY